MIIYICKNTGPRPGLNLINYLIPHKMDIRNRMTKLEEIQDILETCPLDKVTTQTLYDVIMEVIERDEL